MKHGKNYLTFIVGIICIFTILSIIGCASTQSVKKLKGQGMKEQYVASYDDVWEVAISACKQLNLEVEETDKQNGYISASTSVRMESWGEVVGIWIDKEKSNVVEVNVVSRRVGPALAFRYNWEKPILENISKNLIFLKEYN